MPRRGQCGRGALAAALCGALLVHAAAGAAADAAGVPVRASFALFKPSPGNVFNAALDSARAGVASRVAGDLASKAERAGRVKADLDAKADAAARARDAAGAQAAAAAAQVQADKEARAAVVAGAHLADASHKASMGAAKAASGRLAMEFGGLPLGALSLGAKASLGAKTLPAALAAKAALDAPAAPPPPPASKVTVGSGYPPAADFAPGVCTGYAFCIPGHIPPSYVPAIASCPAGYELDENGL
jgi:hypothetical protein